VEVGSDPVGPGSSSSDAARIASIRTVQAPEVTICLIRGAVGAGAAERNILNGSSSSDATGTARRRTVRAPEACLNGGAVGAGAAERNISNY
jgi:hypothetical protein